MVRALTRVAIIFFLCFISKVQIFLSKLDQGQFQKGRVILCLIYQMQGGNIK